MKEGSTRCSYSQNVGNVCMTPISYAQAGNDFLLGIRFREIKDSADAGSTWSDRSALYVPAEVIEAIEAMFHFVEA